VNRVLGAICGRIHIAGGATNGIARGGRKRRANQNYRCKLLNHNLFSIIGPNGPRYIALSAAFATEFTSRAAPRTVLQAVVISAAPTSATVKTFWNMFCSPS